MPVSSARAPRTVPARHALLWYEQAMRLFRRAPWRWGMLGLFTLATDLALQFVPSIGVALSKVLVPVIACGMLVAAADLGRGVLPSLRHVLSAFSASTTALAAIIGAELIVFLVEAIAGYAVADVNLFATDSADTALSGFALTEILVAGTVASLPLAFVPFAALFERRGIAASFATSLRAFALNVHALFIFGVLSLLLFWIGLLTYGLGLAIVFPLSSAASYAAWKDIYGVEGDGALDPASSP